MAGAMSPASAPDVEIGVFGGTFDPPHLGHLNVARDALEALRLDRVIFVPARRSPLKAERATRTPAELRATLCEAAVAGEPGLSVWRGELERPAPSYTVDTLEALGADGDRLTLPIGEEQWARFHLWKRTGRILELARVAVLTRGGYDGPAGPEGPGPWPCSRVAVRRIEISSTEIRSRVREGRSVRFLVPEPVRRIIEQQSLYGSGTGELAGAAPRSS